MKTIKTQIPEGWEIDKDKSTFEEIVLKKIEHKLPLSVNEIPNRDWYIGDYGEIEHTHFFTKNNLSTKERAEAFLALMQLVELRDAWNGDWKADWNDWSHHKYIISIIENEIMKDELFSKQAILHFKSAELRDKFLNQFKDLIETAKELL